METVDVLILDLIEWVTVRERTYEEVMEAWRTSCPRLPIWEEANDRRLIVSEKVQGRTLIRATPLGLTLLNQCRPECR